MNTTHIDDIDTKIAAMNDTKFPKCAIFDVEVAISDLLVIETKHMKIPKDMLIITDRTSRGLVTDFPFTIVIGDNPNTLRNPKLLKEYSIVGENLKTLFSIFVR